MLVDRHGSQVFGQQMQRMLAHAFRRAGFTVTSNAVGVPDFVASRGLPPLGYAVEAKTGTRVNLTKRELEGVRGPAHTAVVAILLFPDFDPRWLFLDGSRIPPGMRSVRRLRVYPAVSLDFDANGAFRQVLSDFHEAALDGSVALEVAFLSDRVRWAGRSSRA
ncbi:MAG: hypothetical protein FJ028_03290 [Chloroflexi bacterium]|nr:hypothetical protein [Chloroflexota bacterium]